MTSPRTPAYPFGRDCRAYPMELQPDQCALRCSAAGSRRNCAVEAQPSVSRRRDDQTRACPRGGMRAVAFRSTGARGLTDTSSARRIVSHSAGTGLVASRYKSVSLPRCWRNTQDVAYVLSSRHSPATCLAETSRLADSTRPFAWPPLRRAADARRCLRLMRRRRLARYGVASAADCAGPASLRAVTAWRIRPRMVEARPRRSRFVCVFSPAQAESTSH
jgi:hypothetical protein